MSSNIVLTCRAYFLNWIIINFHKHKKKTENILNREEDISTNLLRSHLFGVSFTLSMNFKFALMFTEILIQMYVHCSAVISIEQLFFYSVCKNGFLFSEQIKHHKYCNRDDELLYIWMHNNIFSIYSKVSANATWCSMWNV